MKKALITGTTGFAGSFLAELLVLGKKTNITGTYLTEDSLVNIKNVREKINLVKLNLLDADKVRDLIREVKPDLIFHLAGFTSPKDSFDNPAKSIEENIKTQLSVLEAVRKEDLQNTRILIISSAEIYGSVKKKDLPIDEDTQLIPTNPYAVSKIAQDFLGLQYFLSYKLKIIRVRPFNHIGPRQSPNFVVAAFAKKIAEIEKEKRKPVITVGNLESKRDFTDVRDMVYAYSLAIELGKEGDVYNLGYGKSYKISDILKKLLSLSKKKIAIKIDPSLFMPSDNPELVCERTKFTTLSGWKPRIPIDVTLKETLDYWRHIV